MSLRACCGTVRGAPVPHRPDCPHAGQRTPEARPAPRALWRATHPKVQNLSPNARGRTYHWRDADAPLTLCGMLPVSKATGRTDWIDVCRNCRSIAERATTTAPLAAAAAPLPPAEKLPAGLSWEEAVAIQVARDRGRRSEPEAEVDECPECGETETHIHSYDEGGL